MSLVENCQNDLASNSWLLDLLLELFIDFLRAANNSSVQIAVFVCVSSIGYKEESIDMCQFYLLVKVVFIMLFKKKTIETTIITTELSASCAMLTNFSLQKYLDA